MKKISIILGMLTMGYFASAQAPVRMTLFEEFTGENCGPCASTNPGLNAVLAANPTKVIALKWQVPIPSAPSATWSLYRTNQAEIDWRYKSSGYNYPSQNTATNAITNGINSAPSGRFDGQHQWLFGATSDHPFYVSNSVINAAASATTPFSISMNTQWDATFDNAVVTVTIAASSAFTATGNLVFRLCLVERNIEFNTAPGSNGEKDFEDVVRKSYPTTTTGTAVTSMGTNITGNWTPSQTQTYTINCAIPAYIVDKGQMAFVGFIQDDGTKKVWQAARTAQPAIPNEAKALAANVTSVICSSTVVPNVSIKNNGANAITSMTIVPYLNGAPGSNVIWTGNLAAGAQTFIVMPQISPINGLNTYSFNITGVSGGDVVSSNNSKSTQFLNSLSYAATPVTEGFQNAIFPPPNWTLFNTDGNPNTFLRTTTVGGYGLSTASTRYFVNAAPAGSTDYLILPPTNLTGTVYPEFKFDYAYSQVATTNDDRIDVEVSSDCGATWNSIYTNQGTPMATAPSSNVNVFYPTASQWTTVTVPIYSYSNTPGLLVRLGVTPDFGNQIFFDNINLREANTTGISNEKSIGFDFELFPNPATNDINLRISAANSTDAKVSIVNALGQTVYANETTLNQGVNGIRIDSKEFASGFYNVIIESNNTSVVKKLAITK